MHNNKLKKLPLSFYTQDDVLEIAKELLGKILVTNYDRQFTAGRIVETEAYKGESDKASHASKGRTARTHVMFEEGGRSYIYLCYGIHHMFNIVTNKEGIPDAILIRAVEPLFGINYMLQRTGKKKLDPSITRGPGNVGKAFGFHTSQTGSPITGADLYIADDGYSPTHSEINASPRIGVEYAGDHALYQYRFFIKGNPYVSGKRK